MMEILERKMCNTFEFFEPIICVGFYTKSTRKFFGIFDAVDELEYLFDEIAVNFSNTTWTKCLIVLRYSKT